MLATDYQGSLISVFASLIDRGTSSGTNASPARHCSRPARAALRWVAPSIAEQVNVYAGLFHNYSAFEAMPAALRQRLREEQPWVLRGISEATKALHVVDAFGGRRKVASGAMPYQPLGIAARQQSWFLVDDTPRSQIAAGILGVTIGRQCHCLNYYAALLSPSLCTSLRRCRFGP